MSRQSSPALSRDDDHPVPIPLDDDDDPHHGRRPSPAPAVAPRSPPLRSPLPLPAPPDPQRHPPSHPHPSLAAPPSSSSSSSHHALQPQTTLNPHNPRHQLGPGPDHQRQQQQQQHQPHQPHQPIPLQLQPTPPSPVQSYPQNRQIALEPQRPSASSPKHQPPKGGVRGRITVVCAEVLLPLPARSLPC